MKISELSSATQVPVATIKFYIRQGLVPSGQLTSKNQADYGSEHVERVALIKALQEDGGLRLDTIARALHAADTAKEHFVIAAIDALEQPPQEAVDEKAPSYVAATKLITAAIKRHSWKLSLEDVSVRDAISALSVAWRSFPEENENALDPYVDAVQLIAAHEIPDAWQPGASRDAALRYALLGTVLFEPVILALRRMANVARTRKVVVTTKKKKR